MTRPLMCHIYAQQIYIQPWEDPLECTDTSSTISEEHWASGLLKVWEFEKMLENLNAIVAVQVRRSNDANAMGEKERCGESDNGQKVWHTIVALREIADKSWELVNSSNKQLNNGEWMG